MQADRKWGVSRLDDLVEPSRPVCYGVLKPGPFYADGVPLLRITDIESNSLRTEGLHRIGAALDKAFSRSRLLGGEVLLSIQGTVGRVIVAPASLRDANISRTLARISLKESESASFLRQWFLGNEGQRKIDDAIVGTTRASLNIGALREIRLPHPLLPEQRVIAAVLDTLDDAVQKTEQIIAKLKQVKQGLLHDLLTRGIDYNGELRDPERYPEQFQDSPLGRIPREWEVAVFEQQVASTTLGTPRRGESASGDNLRLLKMGNLDWGAVTTADCELVSRRVVGDWRSLLLAPGDLLFNTRNTPELVGKTAAWREATDDVIADNNIMRARFRKGTSGHFVAAFMSSVGRNSVSRLATGTTSVAAIYWRDLRRLPFPCPSSDEQNRIIARVDAVDARESEEASALAKLRAMKAGLAEDLLTGRVRTTSLGEVAV